VYELSKHRLSTVLLLCSCDQNTGGNMGIKIIKNNKLWIEDSAIQHLEKISTLDGVVDIVGLPDLHDGKVPVGTTIKVKDKVYPYLIGNDIGCGMSLFHTHVKLKKLNMKNLIKRLENTKIQGKFSIGGGNHFAELQQIEKIYHQEDANQLYLDKKFLYVLVHSGSRNIGERIYRQYASKNVLEKDTQEMKDYLNKHQKAIEFAIENRVQIADLLMEKTKLKYNNDMIIDCIHNYIEIDNHDYYHHKGSVSSWNQFVIIAGSRGTYSYIVKCIPKEETLYSLSHGAGRKWPRYLCKGRLVGKYSHIDDLKATTMNGKVITNQKELLYEEASEAYKNIDDVIHILLEYGCIELVARLKPMVTYKC
jgi:Uncharacterized conserved protein